MKELNRILNSFKKSLTALPKKEDEMSRPRGVKRTEDLSVIGQEERGTMIKDRELQQFLSNPDKEFSRNLRLVDIELLEASQNRCPACLIRAMKKLESQRGQKISLAEALNKTADAINLVDPSALEILGVPFCKKHVDKIMGKKLKREKIINDADLRKKREEIALRVCTSVRNVIKKRAIA